ncbi:putative antirepressor [Mycobacterium phage Gladiator]|uniref:Antirepressor n=1 Tax=Mycobacterium phage Gladiator TaxID=2920886 RepID=G1BMK7_9CAUD|nr:anti-repressor Ant [Mycobacterium phage Gladiator]AEJ95065.1 putative antirepressor [Mycobacterium phage Gladiator]
MTNLTPTRKEDVSTTEIEKFQFQNVPSADEGGLIINAEVRVVSIDGEPWFVAKDVRDVLGLGRSSIALLDADEKGVQTLDSPSGQQKYTVINESGLYSLILRSSKPQAKAFKKWVTAEVLPTIRKTGAYVDPNTELANKIAAGDVEAMMEGFAKTLQIAKEARAKVRELEAKVEEDKPYVEASKEFFDMEGLYSLRDAARKMGVPPFAFNDILRSWNWIDEKGTAAKAYAVSMGYAENRVYIHPGSGAATTQGRLTNKGLERAAIKLEKEGSWVGYAAR